MVHAARLAVRPDQDHGYPGQAERGEVNISMDNIGRIARGQRVVPSALFETGEGRQARGA